MKYDDLHTFSYHQKEQKDLVYHDYHVIMIEGKKKKKLVGCHQFYALSGHIIKLDYNFNNNF
jgi:hypothetical protein